MFGFNFLLQLLGQWWGPMNANCCYVNVNEFVGVLVRWCVHLNTTHYNQSYLNFLHSQVVRT